MNWIAQNQIKLTGTTEKNQDIWGKIGEDRIYILSSVFYGACADNGFEATGFLSWLRQEELIDYEDRRFSKTVKIGKRSSKCVSLIKRAVDSRQGDFVEIPTEEVEKW